MAEQNVERRLMAADEEEHSSERGRSQRSAMERIPIAQSARSEFVRQGAERLASLLTLSDQPMLAWRLDGYVEFWNSGADGYTGLRRMRRWEGVAILCFKQHFRSLSPNCVLSF